MGTLITYLYFQWYNKPDTNEIYSEFIYFDEVSNEISITKIPRKRQYLQVELY